MSDETNRELAVVVEGDSLREAVEEAGVSEHQPVRWRNTTYVPVWPGCVECLFERSNEGLEPMATPVGEGVYAWEEGGEALFFCNGCGRDVERQIDAVELLTDRWGPNDSDANRFILDRIVGFFPVDDEVEPEVSEFARSTWVKNARAVLIHAGLVDADGPAMKISEGTTEFF